MDTSWQPLLHVRNLEVQFHSDIGDRIVTDAVSYHVAAGETLGIAGESGCGKSVSVLSVMGLLPSNGKVIAGEIIFDGKNLLALSEKELDRIRGKDICMIFQDAMASLNPVLSVGDQIVEAILAHGVNTLSGKVKHTGNEKKQARALAVQMLGRVGLPDPERIMRKYSFEMSGGQRQRVCIAMALCCSPRLLIADEITTALDVTIQSQIMRMIEKIREEMGMSMILISHDIGLIAEMSDRVAVMYAGQIVEEADVFTLFAHPMHPYTRLLIAATPGLQGDPKVPLQAIPGAVPVDYPNMKGCRFAPRCPWRSKVCTLPQMMRRFTGDHLVRCGMIMDKESTLS